MKFEFLNNNPKGIFEGTAPEQWQSWKWQLQKSLKNFSDYQSFFKLSSQEIEGFEKTKNIFQIRTTPYYASLASFDNQLDPLRLIQTPHGLEATKGTQQMLDPLGEQKNSKNARLIHRYADRVLFLVTDFCSVYCRFCTRKRFTGNDKAFLTSSEYQQSLSYIQKHSGIREIILSGGDPLTLSDTQLDKILSDLRAIEHIEIVRIGSRMPTVNPFRITPELVKIIKRYNPVYMMTHFNHPREITLEAKTALDLLTDSGIPVMNQMVLLNGVNNHPATVQALSRRLLYLRVKPYYMFQCDPSQGTDHLRTSIEDSLAIQEELWGHLSGLAMPKYSIDIPAGGGKTTIGPNHLKSHDKNTWSFEGFDGVQANYVNPIDVKKPVDVGDYLAEWEELKSAKE